jgi:hypothetical protein
MQHLTLISGGRVEKRGVGAHSLQLSLPVPLVIVEYMVTHEAMSMRSMPFMSA